MNVLFMQKYAKKPNFLKIKKCFMLYLIVRAFDKKISRPLKVGRKNFI